MNTRLLSLALLAMVALAACAGSGDATGDASAEHAGTSAGTPARPTGQADSAGPASASMTCGADVTTPLTGSGIGDLRIGATVRDVKEHCRVLADSMRSGPEASRERVIVADLGRDTVDAIIVDDRVWRLHVASPAFRTAQGLGVGSTHRELIGRPGATLAHGEGKAFVIPRDPCGLSFRLEGSGSAVDAASGAARDALRADEVLVVGCNTTYDIRGEPRPR